MTSDRRQGGNYRHRSPFPPRRKVSPPSGRLRDRSRSTPRHHDCMDTKEGRRGGSYSSRDYDRRYERGNREYQRKGDLGETNYNGLIRDYASNIDCGSRDYERNCERECGDNGRNCDRADRRYDRNFAYGGAGISHFDGGDRERYRNGDSDAARSRIYQSTSDAGHPGRVLKYGERLAQEDSTLAKFQWNHLLYESKISEGFQGSTHHGTDGKEVRTELDYSFGRSKFFDKGHAGFVLDSEIAPIEAEMGREYSSSSYQMDLGVSMPKNSSQVDALGGFISLPRHFSNGSLHKDEGFRCQDRPHLGDGLLVEGQLATEVNPLQYSRADTDFMASSSQSKALDAGSHGSFKENAPGSLIPPVRVKFCSGVSTNYFGYDYGVKSRTRSPVDCRGRLDDFKSYSRSYVDAAEEKSSKFSYPEVGRSERSAKVTRPIEFYGKMEHIGEQYGRQDMSTVGMLDSNNDKLNGSSPGGYMRGNRLWNPPTSRGQSTSSYYDTYELSYANRQNVHNQDFGSPRPLYERGFYDGHHRSSMMGKLHYDYELAGSSWSAEQGADRLSQGECNPSSDNVDGRLQHELLLDDTRFPGSSKMSKQRYDTEHDSMVYDLGGAGESCINNMDPNILPKKLKITNSKNRKNIKISSLKVHQQPSRSIVHQQPSRSSLVSLPGYSGKSRKFGTQDIKKRLGPCPQTAHVLERLTQKFKPSLKKRLGPGPQKSHFTVPPWVKNLKAPKLPSSEDASKGSHLHQEELIRGDANTPAKPEPPEKSEEFRQLVFSAFFKFVKLLNETPAKRKTYKEQGKAGSLKCIVCGSSSEEFENTESLARHAFQSQKDGVRSQHLGFHKALCALMGWSVEAVNGVWICETMSRTENLCIKEDLILWPPVVIVHNITITNQNPDQRVVITLEKLGARLRDMGFGEKIKVHRGKPANQSIMVVQFGGTLSGLLQAESLHTIYSQIKRGRAEFQQQLVKSCNNGSHNEEAKETSTAEDLENVLYGYMGTAEDLDKLDFDMKKRCVVKSKKHIRNIAEARLKTQ